MNISYLELYHTQDGRCFYCGAPMASVRSNSSAALGWTVDHFYPKAAGNTRHDNKVLCHWHCNRVKGHRMPTPNEIRRFEKLMKKVQERRSLIRQLEARVSQNENEANYG